MVDVVGCMQPRDHVAAARTVSCLCAVAVTVSVVFAPVTSHDRLAARPVSFGVAAVLVAVTLMAFGAHAIEEASRWSWALCPLVAVCAIVTVDLLTSDASASAQLFFFFPTLYGASLLPRTGVVVMTAASLAGDAVVLVGHLPVRELATDLGYMGSVLVTTAVLLGGAAHRQALVLDELRHRASVDPLTGLATRRVLDDAASAHLGEAVSPSGTALIVFDVDQFKTVNDRFGHPVGDRVLSELAVLLKRNCRSTDLACRLGGDEMALLLPDCSLDVGRQRAEQLLQAVREHAFSVETDLGMSVSISAGVSHAQVPADDLQGLYRAADTALYAAKASGRDCVMAGT